MSIQQTERTISFPLQEIIATPGRTQLKEKKAQTDVKQQTSKKKATSVMARVGQSPPTRDPGLRQLEAGKQGHLSSEILKLHNELETCIRKVEELAHRGNSYRHLLTLECHGQVVNVRSYLLKYSSSFKMA